MSRSEAEHTYLKSISVNVDFLLTSYANVSHLVNLSFLWHGD